MHTASLINCRKLHELSGWFSTRDNYYLMDGIGSLRPAIKVGESRPGHQLVLDAPAYDSGYLLKKLPDEATSKKHGGFHYFYMHHNSNYWYAYYGEIDTTELMATAPTPEDACALLAQKLFEQGILKR